MELQLSDKPIIVCASSAGMGKAVAFEFVREGAKVMLCGRHEESLRRTVEEIKTGTGRTALYTVADMTKPADIELLIKNTVSEFGGVYTLFNNSGGPPAGTFDQFDDAAWQSAFELLLLSIVRTIRAVLPHMRKAGGGRIINNASTSVKSPIDSLLLSNAIRSGVAGLSKSLSGELAKDNILVNVIGPGRIQTDRLSKLDAMRAEKSGKSVEEVRQEMFKTIPLGRYGTAEEFAKLAVFLGSPANTYITGQSVMVDGGMVKGY